MTKSEGVRAAKEAEIAELEAKGRPLAIVLVLLGLITLVSAFAGSRVGLAGAHLVTSPVMILVVFLRLPNQRKVADLAKEIRELREEA
jgi:hypothetical protein